MAKIALVDDHHLLRSGLAGLISSLGHEVICEAGNGEELMQKLGSGSLPDLILLDINMPVKDGYETASWLHTNYPEIRILALSMYDNEDSIIRMLKNGARGYILKDSEPHELRDAIESIMAKGFHYTDLVSGRLIHALQLPDNQANSVQLNEREREFLHYACTELTYKEIAEKMFLSPRTIDGYRDSLFEKLNIKTRVGLVMYAIKNKFVKIAEDDR